MLNIIYSVSKSGIFCAKNHNSMLWKCKEDLLFFKNKTTKVRNKNKINALIMGKNTALSINKALPNRINIVLTNDNLFTLPDFKKYNSLENAINWCLTEPSIENIFIIGGKSIILEAIQKYSIRKIYKNIINDVDENTLTNSYDDLIYLHDNELCNYQLINISDKGNSVCYEQFRKIENINNKNEIGYLNLLEYVYTHGEYRNTRNGNVYSVFGKSLEFSLENNIFPLLTSKKMFLKGIFEELKFFLQGKTDTNILSNKGVKIWNGNTSRSFLDSLGFTNYQVGEIGPMYGFQLRNFNGEYSPNQNISNGVDQLQYIIDEIKNNRNSRRLIMTTYNPSQVHQGVLYPCHGIVIQFYVDKHDKLSCIMHQRSADMFLGVPFNITSYALLTMIICKFTNLTPNKLIMNFGDLHIYEQHIHQIQTQLQRKSDLYEFPIINISKKLNILNDIDTFELSDIEFVKEYKSHPVIRAEMVA